MSKKELSPDMNQYSDGQLITTVPEINNSNRIVTVVVRDGQKCIQYGAHVWLWEDFFEVNKIVP